MLFILMSDMLTIPQAAEHFSVSVATIRRWIRSGRVQSQLTLGPFGEQWMVDPDSDPGAARAQAGYVPVEQLQARSEAQADSRSDALLQEAEQALQEAWQARQAAEAELQQLRAEQARIQTHQPHQPHELARPLTAPRTPAHPVVGDAAALKSENPPARDTMDASALHALRKDLQGSEARLALLQAQVEQLRRSESEAWGETRVALRALGEAYARTEAAEERAEQLQTESDWVRRALAGRLGLNWPEHPLSELLLRWEGFETPRASGRRPDWSRARERGGGGEAEASA